MVEASDFEKRYQKDSPVRFEWGTTGAKQVSEDDGCLIVIDVLSFTTAVYVAVSRGIQVFPYPLGGPDAAAFAKSERAELAVRRGEETPSRSWSLSPAALAVAPMTARLVLPSLNGSTIAAAGRGTVVAACLRNAEPVAEWAVANGFGTIERPISVIAAGERWSDGSLRPAIEDALGGGAVLTHLLDTGCELSAEALQAARTFEGTRDIAAAVRSSSSALELRSAGYDADVEAAVAHDSNRCVPVMANKSFDAAKT